MYSYGYDYNEFLPNFDYYSSDLAGLAGILAIFGGIIIGILLIALAYVVVEYVLGSIGMYTIAKNRNLDKPWLVWIPIARDYYIGRIADDINATMAKRSNYRKIILGLAIAQFAFSFISGFISGFTSIISVPYMMAFSIPFTFISYALSIVYAVFYFISFFKILKEYIPENAVLIEVLSIVFNIRGFVLFAIRNKKSGYQLWLEKNAEYNNFQNAQPEYTQPECTETEYAQPECTESESEQPEINEEQPSETTEE